MAIAIRGTTPATASGTSDPISLTLTGTRQPNTNDVLVIIHGNDFFAFSEMPTPTVGGSTSGVTPITNGSADAGANSAHVKSYTYVAGSTGDLTVAVDETGSAGAEEKILAVYVLSGADTATPIDAAANNTGSGTPIACPSVSPTSSNAFLICHINEGTGADNSPWTTPGSMTEQYDISAGGAMGTVGATEQLSASGATGTRSFTPTASSAATVMLSIAVKTGGAPPPAPDLYVVHHPQSLA